MLLFPSKQIAPSNDHYKTVKVQKSSLQLSCIRISLSFSIFIRLQLWGWNLSCFTSDSDIFWKANEKVPSSVSTLSNHAHQKKKDAGPPGQEVLCPPLSAVSRGLPGGTGRGQRVFPLKNGNFCEFPRFSTAWCSWRLGALVSSSSLTSPLRTKSFTQRWWINCVAAGRALRHQKSGSERTKAVHSTSIKSQRKIYYNSLYSSLTQPWANSYTI